MPFPKLSSSWQSVIGQEFDQPYMQELMQFLQSEQDAGKQILPPKDHWFNALNSTPFEGVKVVVLGQDPYPTPGHAHGLCFSVQPDVTPLPKSLLNINKELLTDLNINNSQNGFLQPWAEQGVLLINAVLTVEAGKTNSHQNKGWEQFTDAIIQAVNNQKQHCVFILWGSYAQKKGRFIDRTKHLVLESVHPSPLSAYRGFFGSQPFSKTNTYLKEHGLQEINWQLPSSAAHTQTPKAQQRSLF
ncbi:MAG: uracil-DNA glycosylase [Pseudomonadota bacterium]|nr:uracil-DNA glycosylase [Pseudomonadota bacterium]